MNQSDKEKAYASIRNARALKNNLKASNASPMTKIQYEREFKLLVTKCKSKTPEGIFESICDTRSKRTYYKRRAAVRHVVREGLLLTLQEQDRQQSAGDTDAWYKSIIKLDFLMELHATIEKHGDTCPLAAPLPRKSKRQVLRSLPDDWRQQIYATMANSKYRLAYLVAALSGARPEELEHGIRLAERDGKLTLHIIGAKVKVADGAQVQGQEWREIQYDAVDDHPLVSAALGEVRSHGGNEILVSVRSKVSFTSALRRFGRLLWPRIKSEVTPYVVRNMAASDWKAHLGIEEVAAALGHSVDRTSKFYGQRQIARGSGMLRPSGVRAAVAVRRTRSARPRAIASRHPR